MLRFPLRTGPTEELVWYVAEADALRRVQEGVSSAIRAQLIAETRRWVMRDLRGDYDPTRNGSSKGRPRPRAAGSLADLLERSGESTIENWSDEEWEGFTLRCVWRVCCDGVRDLPAFSKTPGPTIRHRDLLFMATGEDTDSLVNDVLIRLCAAFLDQGFAQWQLPRRDEGFYRAFCALTAGRGPRRSAGCADWPRSSAASKTRASARWNRSANRSRSWASRKRSGTASSPPPSSPCGAGGAWSGRSSPAEIGSCARCRRGASSSSWRSGCCWIGSRWPTWRGRPWVSRGRSPGSATRPAAESECTGHRASSSGPSSCSRSPRSSASRPTSSTS